MSDKLWKLVIGAIPPDDLPKELQIDYDKFMRYATSEEIVAAALEHPEELLAGIRNRLLEDTNADRVRLEYTLFKDEGMVTFLKNPFTLTPAALKPKEK